MEEAGSSCGYSLTRKKYTSKCKKGRSMLRPFFKEFAWILEI